MNRFIPILISLFIINSALLSSACASTEATQKSEREHFIDKMVHEHQFDRQQLQQLLDQAEKKQKILDAISRPAEGTLTWGQYRKIFLNEARITGGVKFWQENLATLQQAEQVYGVAPEIIVAIIGVETYYGRRTGNYRIIDALTTLGFHYPKRSKFFTKELENFLLLTRAQQIDPLFPTGSYAGAMGRPQFMPSSYRAYAVDFDNDNKADIWQNNRDVIGSVANYFKKHGWQKNGQVTAQVKADSQQHQHFIDAGMKPSISIHALKDTGIAVDPNIDGNAKTSLIELTIEEQKQHWLGLHNFYVITRYNHSNLYAMAVFQLSQEIQQRFLDTQNKN